MHWTGLMGMPRRIYTYPEGAGWGWVNMLTTVGGFVLAAGILLVLVNVVHGPLVRQAGRPEPVGRADAGMVDPVAAAALQLRGPAGRRQPPSALGGAPGRGHGRAARSIDGPILDKGKQMMVTSMLDAEPVLVSKVPEDSLWPFFATLAMTRLLRRRCCFHWCVLPPACWASLMLLSASSGTGRAPSLEQTAEAGP